MRIGLYVWPGSSREVVGGVRQDALVVRVTPRAVDGRATEAALRALAAALGIPRSRVELLSGATSRHKVVEVPAEVAELLTQLRDAPPTAG